MRAAAYIAFLLVFSFAKSQTGEVKLLSRIYADSSAFKNNLARGLSASVVPASGVLPATMAVIAFIKKDSVLMDKAIKASVAIAFNGVVSLGMKYFADRQRPFAAYPAMFRPRSEVGPFSFPSGHTSFAFATATSATLSFKKWYVAVPAYAWAAGAGWSRMQQGVHYPSDVLMGALIGTASSFLSFKIEKLMNK
jgi:membrane-associated phospholipid phosphatase